MADMEAAGRGESAQRSCGTMNVPNSPTRKMVGRGYSCRTIHHNATRAAAPPSAQAPRPHTLVLYRHDPRSLTLRSSAPARHARVLGNPVLVRHRTRLMRGKHLLVPQAMPVVRSTGQTRDQPRGLPPAPLQLTWIDPKATDIRTRPEHRGRITPGNRTHMTPRARCIPMVRRKAPRQQAVSGVPHLAAPHQRTAPPRLVTRCKRAEAPRPTAAGHIPRTPRPVPVDRRHAAQRDPEAPCPPMASARYSAP